MWAIDMISMSLGAIVSNKLRTVLTLVGIVAGVASIIAVMTAISVVQGTMEKEMSVLGAQTFQVQKWPAGGFNSDAERRKAMLRPPITLENAEAIREQVESVDLVGSELWDFGFVVEYRGESTNPNVSIAGGTPAPPSECGVVPRANPSFCIDSLASRRDSPVRRRTGSIFINRYDLRKQRPAAHILPRERGVLGSPGESRRPPSLMQRDNLV